MAEIRLIVPQTGGHLACLTDLVRNAQAADHEVVLLTADRPHRHLEAHLRDAGVDVDRVFFVDAVSAANGHVPSDRPGNALYLQSPTMLEMMAMRVEQVLTRMEAPFVVLDSLTTLALYNDVQPVQEFAHYLVNRLRSHHVGADLIVGDNGPGKRLQERVGAFADQTLRMEVAA